MGKAINLNSIMRLWPRKYQGVELRPDQPIAPQARQIFEQLPVNPNDLDLARFEQGLRIALRWQELKQDFNLREVTTLSPTLVAKILAGNVFAPAAINGPIYQREEVTELGQAQVWINRFLYAMEHLKGGEDFDLLTEPKTFFVRGPVIDLRLGLETDPHFANAALPDLNLPGGKFYYIQPVHDNLVALQFRVLTRKEKLVRKYAYDREFPQRFSVYSYREEEQRQFAICNNNLLTPEQSARQADGLNKLKDIVRALINRNKDQAQQAVRDNRPTTFRIAGPARRIKLDLGQGVSVHFTHLNFEPTEIYQARLTQDKIPGTTRTTLAVKFDDARTGRTISTHYFVPKKNDFAAAFTRKVSGKGRISLPVQLRPKLWDDEGGTGIIL